MTAYHCHDCDRVFYAGFDLFLHRGHPCTAKHVEILTDAEPFISGIQKAELEREIDAL